MQIRVVGFPWETASLEAVVRCQDGALLLRRERPEARLWVYRQLHRQGPQVTDTRFERVTFVYDALPLRKGRIATPRRYGGSLRPSNKISVKCFADAGAALKNTTPATSRVCVSVGRFRIEGTRVARRGRAVGLCFAFLFALQVSRPVLESRSDLL